MNRLSGLLKWISGCCAVVVAMTNVSLAQNSYQTIQAPNQNTIERATILHGLPNDLHTDIYPYRRGDVADIALYMLTQPKSRIQEQRLMWTVMDNNEFLTKGVRDYWVEEFAIDSLQYDLQSRDFALYDSVGQLLYQNNIASKRTFLKAFYKTPSHFFELDKGAFYMRLSPMLNLSVGKEANDDGFLFENQRGIELRGGVDGRIFFAANIIETQVRPPTQFRWWYDRYASFPDGGLVKDFTGNIFEFDNAFDFFIADGYVGFNVTRHVGVHLGHGKNFIGDGYRSVFLSDFSKNYFFLKLNWRFWKFHYQNIFAELTQQERLLREDPWEKKWMAAHYLSFNITPKLSIGLFESVIFDRGNGQFEFQYLNPVILYRTVEGSLGSPDNVLLGFSVRWDIWNQVRLYGQIIFDEFRVSEFFGGDQWWGNKYAFQVGARYINAFGIDQLDLRAEYNHARPFTYTHRDSTRSYSHFNQPLAHPLGANFREILFTASYRPVARLSLEARLFFIDTAEDTDSVFFGQNILRPNSERNADFGVEQGQGIGIDNFTVHLFASYMIRQNLFLEARYFRRDYRAEVETSNLETQYVSIGLRYNLYRDRTEF